MQQDIEMIDPEGVAHPVLYSPTVHGGPTLVVPPESDGSHEEMPARIRRTRTIAYSDITSNGGISSEESQESDFDDSSNALWSLYGKEAKSHDEATIQSLKGDMDGVLIFAGLFSAALTAFIIDRSQSIQQTPAQQSAYFQKQSALLLNQISQQLSSLGAQAPISPNISLADPVVNASASDVRVNIYWFLSLVFSLFAALLATLVQGWARDYMRIFKRYSNPRKLARIRQYLHE